MTDDTLVESLKEGKVSVCRFGRTLWWDNEWVVSCRPYRAKADKCLYRGDSLEEAAKILTEEGLTLDK